MKERAPRELPFGRTPDLRAEREVDPRSRRGNAGESAIPRLFVAVELGSGIQGRLAELQEILRRHAGPVRWVEPGLFHLTLKFLGEVSQERTPAVREVLERVAGQHPPLEMELVGVGAFPDPRRPRVLWAGIHDGREPLLRLALHLNREFGALGFEPEARPFAGHVTLGRVRRPEPVPHLEKEMLALQRSRVGRRTVADFCLVQSQLRPAGPIYTVLERFPLRGEPSLPR